ncbi:MAG: hypothetical protein CW691_00935 [Candidatus Bathyarchaeum sp.]|nr:MAG: hypothetical protein CW691_00935 [Candidatus Bathyarchaeum sp.]
MGKHRSRLKILANILSVVSANDGAKKTQIMYQAYLSYKLLVQYLKDVTEAGLVTCGSENCYKLTTKGKAFLVKFSEYNKSYAGVNKQLNYVEEQRMMLEKMCPTTEITNVEPAALERNINRRTE